MADEIEKSVGKKIVEFIIENNLITIEDDCDDSAGALIWADDAEEKLTNYLIGFFNG